MVHSEPKGAGFCLINQYEVRVNDLSRAAISIGPYMFSRSDYFSATLRSLEGRSSTLLIPGGQARPQTVSRHAGVNCQQLHVPTQPRREFFLALCDMTDH